MLTILRTTAEDLNFQKLIMELDAYLKVTDGDEHYFYNQFNSTSTLNHIIMAYWEGEPVGCGAIKPFESNTVEIKRMFVSSGSRGKGIATKILFELELWAKELNHRYSILETGIRQKEAVALYKKTGYSIISNYGQYATMKNSICFKKLIS